MSGFAIVPEIELRAVLAAADAWAAVTGQRALASSGLVRGSLWRWLESTWETPCLSSKCIGSLTGQCQMQPYACQGACAKHCETLVRYCMPYCLEGETPADALIRLTKELEALKP